DHRSVGPGPRSAGGAARPDLRAVLHHQGFLAAHQRNGTRAHDGVPKCHRGWRRTRSRRCARWWRRVHGATADLRGRNAMNTIGRILLADDEPVFAEATADLLRREGYE